MGFAAPSVVTRTCARVADVGAVAESQPQEVADCLLTGPRTGEALRESRECVRYGEAYDTTRRGTLGKISLCFSCGIPGDQWRLISALISLR